MKLKKKRLSLAKLGCTVSESMMKVKPMASTQQGDTYDLARLMSSLTLPKLEIEPFSGSADEFVTFISTFKSHIESQVSDPNQRLSYLI